MSFRGATWWSSPPTTGLVSPDPALLPPPPKITHRFSSRDGGSGRKQAKSHNTVLPSHRIHTHTHAYTHIHTHQLAHTLQIHTAATSAKTRLEDEMIVVRLELMFVCIPTIILYYNEWNLFHPTVVSFVFSSFSCVCFLLSSHVSITSFLRAAGRMSTTEERLYSVATIISSIRCGSIRIGFHFFRMEQKTLHELVLMSWVRLLAWI